MKPMHLDQVVRKIDRRLERVEQILPTLPTKEELERNIATLVTREELERTIATLATRDELREEFERSRRHTDVLFESLKGDIQLLADGVVKVQATLDQVVQPKLVDHERRITVLEDTCGQAGSNRRR
jgi:hypothetical protein